MHYIINLQLKILTLIFNMKAHLLIKIIINKLMLKVMIEIKPQAKNTGNSQLLKKDKVMNALYPKIPSFKSYYSPKDILTITL